MVKKAEAIANLILPDGIAATLQGNIESQYAIRLSDATLTLLVELTRKELASRIEDLAEDELKKI